MADLRGFFNELYTQHNRALTPRMVVERTRDETHEFHERYWGMPDSEAAYEWRILKAADDIRSFRIKYREPSDTDSGMVREWVSLTRGEGQVYVKTEEAAQDPVTAEIMLRAAEREWRAMLSRYQHLEEFINMVRGSLPPKKRPRR